MLLDSLKAKQIELDLSDTQFAAKINVSFDLWRSLRYGRRRISTFAIQGIITAFPEFKEEVFEFLTQDGTDVPKSGTIAHIETPDADESEMVEAGR